MSVRLWSWWDVVYLEDANLLLIGAVLAGLVLYLYVLSSLGMALREPQK